MKASNSSIPRLRVIEGGRHDDPLKDDVQDAVGRTAARILARLEPGSVWRVAEAPVELRRVA